MKKSIILSAGALLLALTPPSAMFAKGTVDLQGVTFSVDTVAHFPIGPGLTQSKLVFTTSGRSFNAFVLDLDKTAGDKMRVKVDVGRDSCNTAEAITSIAKRKTDGNVRYLGGINGDFFITSSFAAQHEFGNAILGYPNMSCVTEGKIVAPDMIDITSRENALIIGSDGMWIDATDLKYRLLNNDGSTVVDARAVNYPRRDGEMVVYNSYMGKYTKTSPQGRELVLRLADGAKWAVNKSVKFIVDGDWHSGQSAIPQDGIVISCGPKYSNEFIDGLKKGDIVKLKIVLSLPAFNKLKPDVLEVCGGDVRILKENVTTTEAIRWINTPSAKYSRSLVGYSQDRNHVVMCAVDASSASSGVTYYEAADVMRYLGCYDALDLDGGGSTAIWSHSHGIFNNLRDGSERAVGNCLFFVLDAPASADVTSIGFADHVMNLPRYGLYRPVIYGYNEHGQLVDTGFADFVLEAPEALGTVTDDGKAVLVTGSGTFALTARSGDRTARVVVTVSDSSPATPRVTSFLTNGYRHEQIVLEAPVGEKMMEVAATAYDWSVVDPAVASVTPDGQLLGLKDGTTVVVGTLGDNRIEIPVTVEIPRAPELSLFDTWDVAGWTLSKSSINPATVTAVEGGGLEVDYKVTSTRGPSLTLTNKKNFYSLPDGVEITCGQDEVALSGITLNILPANVTRSVAVEAESVPAAGKIGKVKFNIAGAIDLDNPAVYPVQFVSLRFVPGGKTGTYKLHLPAIASTYSYYQDGVQDITIPGLNSETLVCNVDGRTVSLPFTADAIDVFSPSGALVAKAAKASGVTVPAAGLYIVRATLGTKVLTARVVTK